MHAGLLALALAAPLAPAPAQQLGGQPDDARVRQAWSFLLPAEQADLAARFTAEVEALGTFQGRLVRHVLARAEIDPGLLAEDRPAPFFDPRDHAPGQPIPRRRLEPGHALLQAARHELLAGQPARSIRSAWRYDWGRREVLRSGDFRAPQHVFENALAGYAPGVDLAEALVEQRLDRGEQQLRLAAFARAYTDREGGVYPGITLYDAWGSGRVIEMPDVDCLGLVHSLTGERGRWVAPIPAEQHDELYAWVAEQFEQAQRYRELRTALAQCYLVGTGPLAVGYQYHQERLHGLWEEYGSSPDALADVLPRSDDVQDFLATWGMRFEQDEERTTRARARAVQLDRDAERVRRLLVGILRDVGAFERERRPTPETEPGGE